MRLRTSECWGLAIKDIDESGVIHVRRGYTAHGRMSEGKTENAQRSFKMNAVALSVYKDQLRQLEQNNLDTEWLFPDEYGCITKEQQFYRRFKVYCEHNGIDNMTPYELRHTYVSLNKDMPEDLLKLQVGHSKAMPTREQYSHERAGDSERAAELSSIALKKVLKKRGK